MKSVSGHGPCWRSSLFVCIGRLHWWYWKISSTEHKTLQVKWVQVKSWNYNWISQFYYTDINDAFSVRLFVTCYVQRLRELCGAKITVVQVLVIAGGKFSTFPKQTHKGLASKQRCACVWNTTRKKPQQIQRAASRSVQTATSAQAVLSFARSV